MNNVASYQQKTLCSGLDLLSHFVAKAVSSALRRFKTLFGMGRVGSTTLQRPEHRVLSDVMLRVSTLTGEESVS